MERGVVEVAPLAFMRGRTLNDAFIILDEAQNTTPEQMKMFLTRLGFGSKAVVNGDATQVDLPNGQSSGLRVVEEILTDIDGLSFVHLGGKDVVRHEIVQHIVEAYGRFGQQTARGRWIAPWTFRNPAAIRPCSCPIARPCPSTSPRSIALAHAHARGRGDRSPARSSR